MADLKVERTIDTVSQRIVDSGGGESALLIASDAVAVAGEMTVERTGDGADVLTLATERRWAFRQLGTGARTGLELASLGGAAEGQPIANKDFVINTLGGVGIRNTSPQEALEIDGGVRINRRGEGVTLLTLGTERRWEFRQLRTGAGTALELASLGGAGEGQPIANKDLIINTTGAVGIGITEPKFALDVKGSIRASEDIVLAGADCAEEFDIDDETDIVDGTVLVIRDSRRLSHCTEPYDRRVAGIISGSRTGDRPGIVLGRRPSQDTRVPLALMGTVWCRVDASPAPVGVGDLLTTSALAGHAMRAIDATRSFGAIVGKALTELRSGTGLVRVLVTLQ